MIEDAMHDQLCNRHEVTAVADDSCPYCRIERLQAENESLKRRVLISPETAQNSSPAIAEAAQYEASLRVERLQAKLDAVRFGLNNSDDVTDADELKAYLWHLLKENKQ